MDADSEIKEVLEDAGISVSKESLENPTEDFMMHVISECLKKFNFDVDNIIEPTQEQQKLISTGEPFPNIFKVINLHAALSSFCQDIFIKDFLLTDITNPGAKKAKKTIKFLFNFWNYVRTKTIDNECYLKELEDKGMEIKNMINRKDDIIIKIGELIIEQEKKQAIIEQKRQNILEVQKEILKYDVRIKELAVQVDEAHDKHKETKKIFDENQAQYTDLHIRTSELECLIVDSPEEYNKKLQELKDQLQNKQEERNILNEAISKKTTQVNNNEQAAEIITSLHKDKLKNTKKTLNMIKQTKEQLENIEKELNSIKLDISKLNDTNGTKDLSKVVDKVDDKQIGDQLCIELDQQSKNQKKQIKNQINNKKKLNKKLSEQKNLLEEKVKMLDDTENEYKKLIKGLQEIYSNEIKEQRELEKSIMDRL